jgi:hypothetical protein
MAFHAVTASLGAVIAGAASAKASLAATGVATTPNVIVAVQTRSHFLIRAFMKAPPLINAIGERQKLASRSLFMYRRRIGTAMIRYRSRR